jgi:1-pyrroline-5-carboxylate dehydrogenase
MGGKDSIVVAADADLDAAAEGIVASAFGFAGQKCSACSRAIIDASVYDALTEKIVARTKALAAGDPADRGTYVCPVINESAMTTILSYIEKAKAEGGEILTGGGRAGTEGWFVAPTVVGGVKRDATIALEEIFGPVLALIRAADYDDALAIANNTEFGLTGSVYSTDDAKLERARDEFHVGNLYFNRKCTGAFVGAHPFGGFNMSGTDSKAGGYDYLGLFMQAKMVSKKLGTSS